MRLATSRVSKSSFRGNTSAEHTAAATFANRGGEKPFSNVSMSRRPGACFENRAIRRAGGGPVGRSFGRKTTLRAAIIYIMTLQASACGEIIYMWSARPHPRGTRLHHTHTATHRSEVWA